MELADVMRPFWDIHILLAAGGKVGDPRVHPMALLPYAYAWVSSEIALQIPLTRSLFTTLMLTFKFRYLCEMDFSLLSVCLFAPVTVMYHVS